jgi:hypothetical protein
MLNLTAVIVYFTSNDLVVSLSLYVANSYVSIISTALATSEAICFRLFLSNDLLVWASTRSFKDACTQPRFSSASGDGELTFMVLAPGRQPPSVELNARQRGINVYGMKQSTNQAISW